MKKNYFGLMLFILVLIIGCKNSKDMSLYLNDNLNDSEHIGNLKIKNQKEEVLNRIIEFDNWYRENSGKIDYQFDVKFWNVGWNINVDDNFRISYLKDSIIPRIPACNLITNALKNKAEENIQSDDPGNVGVILTGSENGKDLSEFTYMLNSTGFHRFHSEYFLDDEHLDEDIDLPPLRDISYEEAKFYHLSFIKLIDDSHAIYRTINYLTNGSNYNDTYLILKLVKNNGEWLIDDMSYIEEEELIENETGFTLINYFENKEAYETGVKK